MLFTTFFLYIHILYIFYTRDERLPKRLSPPEKNKTNRRKISGIRKKESPFYLFGNPFVGKLNNGAADYLAAPLSPSQFERNFFRSLGRFR